MKTNLAFVTRGLLVASCLGAAALLGRAGEILGTVTNDSGDGSLSGAVITILETGRTSVTDQGGRFSFKDLPEGRHTLRVSYLGYDDKTEAVTVPAVGVAPVAIRMGQDVIALEKFVVEGYREGRSRALQQKQSMTNITDLVSADSIGNLPDRNVAEAVSRLPGVNVSLDQGEGRYVSIRGVEPSLNQVLLDGATMAAPGGFRLGRATPLDTLGSGQISQIEVIKSVTPDLDANSLGGTLNIKSRSAFDHKGRFLVGSVAGNRDASVTKSNLEAQLTYTDTFGPNERFGLAASLSYDNRDYSNDLVQAEWQSVPYNGTQVWVPTTMEFTPEWGSQERAGVALNLEYRPNNETQFFLRPGYSSTSQIAHNFIVNHSAGGRNVTLTSPTTGYYETRFVGTDRRELLQRKDQTLFNIAGGLKKVLGEFTIEPLLTYSAAEEDKVYDRNRQWRNGQGRTGQLNFEVGDFEIPLYEINPSIDSPSGYQLRRTRDDWGTVNEKIFTAKTDARWDSSNILGHPGYLKAGVKYLHRSRVIDLSSSRLIRAAGAAGNWNLGQIGVLPGIKFYHDRYDTGFLLDMDKTNAFLAANPTLTRHEVASELQNSIEDDYDIDEYIYSAYVMGSTTIDHLTLLGGVRWEKTDATTRSVESREADGNFLGHFPTSGTTSYDKLFPNLQAVYRFTDGLLLRAAITQTIGRPAYEDSTALSFFEYENLEGAEIDPKFPNSGSLEIGNPQLKPYEAMNYDLSLEWYPKRGRGVFSIAAFRKEIDDPIYTFQQTQRNVIHSGVALQELNVSSVRNAESGRISGIELNIYQPFSFLPSPFDGFGIDANLTLITSSTVIPGREKEDIPFFRQPSKIANLTLFYEKGRFSGRVAWNYSGEQIYELGEVLFDDKYRTARDQYDLQLRYRISSHYAITASVRNLTSQPEEISRGVRELLYTSRLLDRDYRVSIDFNF